MDQDADKDAYISIPIGVGRYASITEEQYRDVCADIEKNQPLIDSLNDFKRRWHSANESDDPNAFAGDIELFGQLRAIVYSITNNPSSTLLANKIALRYLRLS